MQVCYPYDVALTFYEKIGSRKQMLYEIRVMSPDEVAAQIVARGMLSAQFPLSGKVTHAKVTEGVCK